MPEIVRSENVLLKLPNIAAAAYDREPVANLTVVALSILDGDGRCEGTPHRMSIDVVKQLHGFLGAVIHDIEGPKVRSL